MKFNISAKLIISSRSNYDIGTGEPPQRNIKYDTKTLNLTPMLTWRQGMVVGVGREKGDAAIRDDHIREGMVRHRPVVDVSSFIRDPPVVVWSFKLTLL